MLRAVFDTNVLVSALIQPRSPPGLLLAMLVEGKRFELIVSSAILDEFSRALRYPAVRKRIKRSDEDLDSAVAMIDALALPVEISIEVSSSRDPDDDKILATAVEGGADYVVTGDADLLSLQRHVDIRIVTPREFLKLLEQ